MVNLTEIYEDTIRFMLRNAGHEATLDDIRENQFPNGIPWYQYYTQTAEQEEQVKQFFLSKIKRKVYKALHERYWAEFNLMWGLKIQKP